MLPATQHLRCHSEEQDDDEVIQASMSEVQGLSATTSCHRQSLRLPLARADEPTFKVEPFQCKPIQPLASNKRGARPVAVTSSLARAQLAESWEPESLLQPAPAQLSPSD